MSRRKKHIELSDTEYNRLLRESKHHNKYEYREKCRALLLNHAGVSIKQIAAHLQISHITVGNWLIAWEIDNFESLPRKKGQGCKAILTLTDPVHVALVDKAVGVHRQNVNQIKSELVSALDKPMSTETVRRFLKKIVIPGSASGVVRIQRKTK